MFCEASLVTLMFSPPHFEYIPMQLIVSALFLVSDILLYRTMVHTEQRVQLEVENQLLEKQLDAQLAHYSDLTGQYEQIRAMRHDISHHLNTINALLQAGNLKAASEYSEQLLPMQTDISRLGKCKTQSWMRSCTAACRMRRRRACRCRRTCRCRWSCRCLTRT